MKKLLLLLLLLCSLFISCFTEPKKMENESVEKVPNTPIEQEKLVPVQKESTPLNLEILISLLNKDRNQIMEWTKNNGYSIIDDGFYKHLSVENSSTWIIFDIYESPRCSSISIYKINEENFKLLLKETKKNYTEDNCYYGDSSLYSKMIKESSELVNCFSNDEITLSFNDKSLMDERWRPKKEKYFSIVILRNEEQL